MKIVATMPVRNEAWILGLSARAVLMWADELIILDHCSTDGSREIEFELAQEHFGHVTVLHENNPVWEEMRHRQALLDAARSRGATHIAMVDADEVLSGNLLPDVRRHFEITPPGATLQLPWVCLAGSIDRYYAAGIWAHQDVSMGFRDDPAFHWAAREGYDFHHRHPMGKPLQPFRPLPPFRPLGQPFQPPGTPAPFQPRNLATMGGLMHLQFVSSRRLKAKQSLYKCTEVLRWPNREPVDVVNRRYNVAVYGCETFHSGDQQNQLGTCSLAWWRPYEVLLGHLKADAEPWQEAELRRLVQEHGLDRFAGLDLFGVI